MLCALFSVQLLKYLEYMEIIRMLHMDLKPANLLIKYSGGVCVGKDSQHARKSVRSARGKKKDDKI